MPWTTYAFAIFIFALVAAVVFFNDRLKRSRMDQQDEIKQKEQRMFQLFYNLEEMMDSLETFAETTKEEIRKEKVVMAEMLLKTEQMINNFDVMRPPVGTPAEMTPPPAEAPAKSKRKKPQEMPENKDLSKVELVKKLHDEGYSIEQISQELGISRGEATLIVGVGQK